MYFAYLDFDITFGIFKILNAFTVVESSESALEKEVAAMRREVELLTATKSTTKTAKETDRERELKKELGDLKSKVITRESTKKKEKLDEAARVEALEKKVKETKKKKELIKGQFCHCRIPVYKSCVFPPVFY